MTSDVSREPADLNHREDLSRETDTPPIHLNDSTGKYDPDDPDNPLIASELEGLSVSGVRRLPVVNYPRYSIFYHLIDDKIEIIRLGFGGRDWDNNL